MSVRWFSAHQVCIYLPKNTVKIVILWNIITILKNSFVLFYILKCNLFLWCKTEFSASLPSSQCHISYQCWNANSFLESVMHFFQVCFDELKFINVCPCWLKVLISLINKQICIFVLLELVCIKLIFIRVVYEGFARIALLLFSIARVSTQTFMKIFILC